ncbi:uncharacterized protein TM35_000301350 [Trypanosoma theileri]|uniref:Uncharacterized protein n=1 Tax=Trypanosoma theileri TaxID=67003 RepID=A0A1X0NN03_9TRYP|nr:uncharacterized protein TM35_000301350 [Trypanosoma theileri]ORC86095.1 hypothetical protein TM35_000301350 [Trypanosoma theileri]
MVESSNSEKTRNNKTHEGKKDHKNYSVKGNEGKHKNQSTFSHKRVTITNNNNNHNHNNNNNNNNNNKKKNGGRRPTAVEETERYVVVITNVENDFAKVHREAIPRYCCLNEQHCHSHQLSGSSSLNGITSTTTTRQQCRYTVTPRTETRSVEVAVYGKADGDVSTVFLPVRTNTHTNTTSSNNHSHPNSNKEKKKDGEMNIYNDPTMKEDEEEDNTVIECVKPPVGREDTLFATLEDMTMALRHKPYFTHPPKFLLNVAGKDDGDVLRECKRSKRDQAKQQKHADEDDDDNNDNDDYEEDEKKKSVKKSDDMDSPHLRQAAVRQADMITAVATTSARMSTKDMQYQLRDVPGFITCWMLYPQHFRVVFASQSTLFKAKQLLDQFAVDGNVRVGLTLADAAAKEFTAYITAQEDTA